MTSTDLAAPPADEPASRRRRTFLLLLLVAHVLGMSLAVTEVVGVGGWRDNLGVFGGATSGLLALVLWIVYMVWVYQDICVRGVADRGWVVCQLLIAVVPIWGLLAYLVLTRWLGGILNWVAFVAAVWIAGGLGAGIGWIGALALKVFTG